ncbi:MAG: class I SAM-dependent methyltransferase [Trueperaceae bacterium]
MNHPPFSALADIYDQIMADVEYDEWLYFILSQAGMRGFRKGPVLDLGCGTGNITIPLAERGLDPTGVDSSVEMLAVARRKAPELDWRNADFTSFALERRFSLAVSIFDSLNNLLTKEQFLAAANRVREHLLPGGLFLFDVNTTTGLRDLWEGGRVEGWAGEIYYRWTHSYDAERDLARVEAYCDDGKRSFTEVHFERPFDPDEVVYLLEEAGFSEIETITYPNGLPAEPDEERIWVFARVAGADAGADRA